MLVARLPPPDNDPDKHIADRILLTEDQTAAEEGTHANLTEYSVSEIAFAIKRTVEDRFGLVRVRAELSGYKQAASGHAYMALKDDKAVLDGVMWKGGVGRLRFRPEDGLEVIVTGKLTTYPGRSKYQLVIEQMEPAGVGALMALLEERKKKLAAEGLFDGARKRLLPYLPQVIGVITSPTGAVIRDIIHRIEERFPRHILLWPVIVQGEGAAAQVAAAVRGFNTLGQAGTLPRPDVLIVARGGGSIEDLWAFNEEIVVRAVAESAIPVISAVGHETDTTLVDFVSDRRAPTPTAAAEMAVPVRADLLYTVDDLAVRLGRAARKGVAERRERVTSLQRGLPQPRLLLTAAQQRLDELAERQPRAARIMLERRASQVAELAGRLVRPDQMVRAARQQAQALDSRLTQAARSALARRQADLQALSRALQPRLIAQARTLSADRLVRAGREMERSFGQYVRTRADRLASAARLLRTLGYHETLQRGFAVVRQASDNSLVTGIAQARAAGQLEIELRDGTVAASVSDGTSPAKPARQAEMTPKKPAKKAAKPQASLFDDF